MRQMKDSGIEWIGQIPENINVIRNKYLIKYEKGKLPKDLNTEKIGIPYVGASELEDLSGEAEYTTYTTDVTIPQCDSSDVLILWDGARAGLIGTNHKGAVSSTIVNALPIKELDKRFWYWYLKAFQQHLYNRVNGTTIPHMNTDYIEEIAMLDWETEEQLQIAHFLDAKCDEIDALIEAKEKTNALLRERRQSIIYEAVTKGLNSDAPMKDSGIEWIGEIPIDWDVFPVKYLLDKKHPYPIGDGDHGMIKADDYLSEGIPYVRVLNLTWGDGLNLETLVYISEEMNNRIKNSELKPNDILIAKTGATIGKTAIVPESLPRSNTTSHVGKITISNDHDPKFFYYVMTSSVIQTQIQILSAMQSTRPELGIDGLRNLLVVVPPVEKQQDIATYLNHQCAELNSAIATNASMIEKLKEYRQSIIYEAVTGKIEI